VDLAIDPAKDPDSARFLPENERHLGIQAIASSRKACLRSAALQEANNHGAK
jgi:hypothetical protein